MNRFKFLLLLVGLCLILTRADAEDAEELRPESRIVCFYDTKSTLREGSAKLTNALLEIPLINCTHLVYGYVGIRGDNYQVKSLNEDLDIKQNQFATVTSFRKKYPHLKVLLSVGGDRDIDEEYPDKYLGLMEAGREKEKEFIESAYELVKQYEFDGLDLAYQFPRTMPQNISQRWVQFNDLVLNLSKRFRPNGLLLTLTVLPRVNSKWYIHAVGIESNLDFVNVAAFDFVTPTQSPQQADYTAPLYHDPSQYRDPFYNVDMQVRSWVSRPFRPLNLNLGIGMYGNAWATTYFSGSTGEPIVQITDGPAKGYPFTREGTVSYPQICHLLRNSNVKKDYQSGLAGERAASFAYRPSVGSYHKGYWVTYDNLLALAKKAKYARKHVGGVAIFDLGYDDYEGYCTEEKFLFFNHIRSYFLQPEQPDPTIELHEFPLPEP